MGQKVWGTVDTYRYRAYILKSGLIAGDGLTLTLLTEFCESVPDAAPESKQDCELKDFRRLAKRLKRWFGGGDWSWSWWTLSEWASIPLMPCQPLGLQDGPARPLSCECVESVWCGALPATDTSGAARTPMGRSVSSVYPGSITSSSIPTKTARARLPPSGSMGCRVKKPGRMRRASPNVASGPGSHPGH